MAKGSQTTPAKDMPRTCAICGQRILTSKQAFQHHVDDLTHTHHAWHIACKQGGTMNETETSEPETPTPTEPEPTDEPDDGDDE